MYTNGYFKACWTTIDAVASRKNLQKDIMQCETYIFFLNITQSGLIIEEVHIHVSLHDRYTIQGNWCGFAS